MNYNELNNMTRNFLSGVDKSEKDEIINLLESISPTDSKDKESLDKVKELVSILLEHHSKVVKHYSNLRKIVLED